MIQWIVLDQFFSYRKQMADEKMFQKVLCNQAEWVSLGFSAFMHFVVGWKSQWVLVCCLKRAENTVTPLKIQIIVAVNSSLSNLFWWLRNPWILLFSTPWSILCFGFWCWMPVNHSWVSAVEMGRRTTRIWGGRDMTSCSFLLKLIWGEETVDLIFFWVEKLISSAHVWSCSSMSQVGLD